MACFSRGGENSKQSNEIEKMLRDERKVLVNNTCILLLGAGESGKSTIFKQLKILQDGDGTWTPSELADFKNTIYINITTQLHVLISAAEKLAIELDPENIERSNRITSRDHLSDNWTKEVGEDCIKLWSDNGIKKTYEKRDREFQLNDSAEYFFTNLQRITQPDYIPIPQDALRARVMTKGIVEADIKFDHINMKIIDVGGQRSQRRKWIHCFDKVSAVIFVAGISEYDQFLREDSSVNKFDESLTLFSEICNSQWFDKCSMILFLNKKDMFIEKLKRVPFKTYDPKYGGENTFEAIAPYLQKKFENVKKDPNKVLYPHFTIAVDTQNIEFVFKVVKKIIVGDIMNQFH